MQDIGTMANHKIKLKEVFDIQSTKSILQHQIADITGPLDASSTTSLPSKAPFSCLGWNASGWAGTSLRVWLGWNVDRRLRGTVEESPGAYSAFHLSSHATTGVVNTGRRSTPVTPRHQTRLLIVSRQASRCDGALTGRKSVKLS